MTSAKAPRLPRQLRRRTPKPRARLLSRLSPAARAAALALLITAVASTSGVAQSNGERLYVDQGCAVCHGLIGEGGVGPSLVGDRFLAFQDYVVARVLMGGGEMPPFAGTLSDEEIAAVASHIRESWGNGFGAVSGQQVVSDRKHLQSEAAKSGSSTAPQGRGSQPGSR